MDNLDIVTLVVQNLQCNERIGRYASVSRLFQYAVESITFRHVGVYDDAKDQEEFTAAFHPSRGRRRSVVRSIGIYPGLDNLGLTEEEHRLNEELLLSATSFLFHELHSWEVGVPSEALGRIAVSITCTGPDRIWMDDEGKEVAKRRVTLHERDVSQFPAVAQIVELETRTIGPFTLHGASLFRLASRCPNLEVLNVGYLDGSHREPRLRLQQHYALAEAINNVRGRLPRLVALKMNREGGYTPANQSYRCLNMEQKGLDPVCSALRMLIQESNLRKVELSQLLISSDLFRDRRTEAEGGCASGADTSALWPSLRSLDILLGPVAPSGEWYTTGHPDEEDYCWPEIISSSDSDFSGHRQGFPAPTRRSYRGHAAHEERPQHEWRSHLNSEMFDPLLLDMLAIRVPGMESGEISVRYRVGGDEKEYYFAFGTKSPFLAGRLGDWMTRLTTNSSWTPPKGVPATVLCFESP